MITAAARRRRQPKVSPKLAIAYVRVSTDAQDLSIQAQRAAIERWACGAGVTIAAWCADEDVSGAALLDERAGLMDALAALRERAAGVLVLAKRDRLARDVGSAAAIERLVAEAGARIVTADGMDSSDTPEGQLMRTLVDAMAQYERALIRARTKAALAVKKARGERVGAVPFGYESVDGKLVALEHEQAALTRMHELRAGGAKQPEIAAALTAEGFKPRGAKWNVTTVARALARS